MRYFYISYFAIRKRQGFTLMELLLVIAIIAVLATVSVLNLNGRRAHTELDGTAKQIASILREAEGRAVSQDSGASWGVHFENAAAGGFFALYATSYAPNATRSYSRLPVSVRYAPASIPVGNSVDVAFAQITGLPSGAASVTVESIGGTSESMTVTVGANGLVSI